MLLILYIHLNLQCIELNISIAHHCMQFFPRIIFGLVKGEERGQGGGGGGGSTPFPPLGETLCMYVFYIVFLQDDRSSLQGYHA